LDDLLPGSVTSTTDAVNDGFLTFAGADGGNDTQVLIDPDGDDGNDGLDDGEFVVVLTLDSVSFTSVNDTLNNVLHDNLIV
jgi:hypothetical protein